MNIIYILFVLILYITNSESRHRSKYRNHINYKLLPSTRTCGLDLAENRIFGGTETGLDELPWMAIISYKKNFKSTGYQCGGALINKRYVLTAAHCISGVVTDIYGHPDFVSLGEHDLHNETDCMEWTDFTVCNPPPLKIKIEMTIAHAAYDDYSENKYDDIGLLRLSEPVVYRSNIQPICLPLHNEHAFDNEKLVISGWGRTDSSARSNIKLKTFVPLIPNYICEEIFYPLIQIEYTQVCAGGEPGIDSCNGDSGGPLMRMVSSEFGYNFFIEGIVSFGLKDCGKEGAPGVYTRVTSYMTWILNNIEP